MGGMILTIVQDVRGSGKSHEWLVQPTVLLLGAEKCSLLLRSGRICYYFSKSQCHDLVVKLFQ